MPRREYIRPIFTENIGFKILALFITIFLWTFVMGRDDAIETKDLDVEVFAPASHELALIEPSRVQVTLKGTPKLLRRYFKNKKVIRFDIYNTDSDDLRLEIKDDKLEVPFGLRIVSITPRHIDIRLKTREGFEATSEEEEKENSP